MMFGIPGWLTCGLATLVAVVVAVLVLVTVGLHLLMRSLASAKLLALPESDPRIIRESEAIWHSHAWATEKGFILHGYYVGPQGGLISAWEQPGQPVFFAMYVIQGVCAYDLVTVFSDDVGLTTGSNRDGQLLPKKPGHYDQTFSNTTLEQRWQRHCEAEQFLIDAGGARKAPNPPVFEELFVDGMRSTVEHVRSLRLWTWRMLYWFLVRRYRWHNVSVREQHERGWIRLPNRM